MTGNKFDNTQGEAVKKIKKQKKEIVGVDRREFLTKASLALMGLGVSPTISAEILGELGQMILPHANAQSAPGGRRRHVAIKIRAGYPLYNLSAPGGWVPSATNTVSNAVNFHTAMDQITTNMTSSGRPVYLPVNAAALAPHVENIAYHFSQTQMDGHTSLWSNQTAGIRVDDANVPAMTPASPGVYNAGNQQLGAMLGGVDFNSSGGSVTNSANMYAQLSRVTNANVNVDQNDDFIRMFGPKALRLTNAERDAVLRGVSALGDAQLNRLKARLSTGSVDEAKKAQQEAITLLQTNIQAAIIADYNTNRTTRGFNVAPPRGLGYDLSKALNLGAIAFTRNLASSIQIAMDGPDYHGFNSTDRSGNMLTAQMGAHLANNLAAFIAYLKATPDSVNGGMLWDNTVIEITTEFTRDTTLDINSDNGDGGAAGTWIAGGPVRGGFLGTLDNNGARMGFNPTTGAPGGALIHPSSHYKTILTLLGYSQSAITAHMGAGNTANTFTLGAMVNGTIS